MGELRGRQGFRECQAARGRHVRAAYQWLTASLLLSLTSPVTHARTLFDDPVGAAGSVPCIEGCNAAWLTKVATKVRVSPGNEWLPTPEDSTDWMRGHCQEAIAAAIAASAVAESRNHTDGIFAQWDDHVTVGKYVHFAAASLFLQASRGNQISLTMPYRSKEGDLWSKYSECSSPDAWVCLFGAFPLPAEALTQAGAVHPENVAACRALWDLRTDPSTHPTLASFYFLGVIGNALVPEPFESSRVSVKKVHHVADGSGKYIVVHIRRGDACEFWLEEKAPFQNIFWAVYHRRPCYRWEVYHREVEKVSQLYKIKTVLILSEDPEAVKEATDALGTSFNLMWLEYDRSKFHMGKGWIENWGDLDSVIIDSALKALSVGRDGHVLVGHFFSHFTKALYIMMTGRRGVAPPFVSIDGGGVYQLEVAHQPLPDALGNTAIRRHKTLKSE